MDGNNRHSRDACALVILVDVCVYIRMYAIYVIYVYIFVNVSAHSVRIRPRLDPASTEYVDGDKSACFSLLRLALVKAAHLLVLGQETRTMHELECEVIPVVHIHPIFAHSP